MIAWSKVWTVAVTEFLHAVRSKAFLIGVALLPTIGIISALMPKFAGDEVDKTERKVAIVDTTDRLYPMLSAIFDGYNAKQPHTVCPTCGWYKGRVAVDVNA